jgi:hypothetical protein
VQVAEPVRVREINDDEGKRLLRIIRRGSGSVVTWRRAQMVLLSAQGMPVAKIAEVTFTSPDRGVVKLFVGGMLRVRRCVVGPVVGPCSEPGGHAGDLVPDGEAVLHFGAVGGGGHQVAQGRKWGEIRLNADRNRCVRPVERKRL